MRPCRTKFTVEPQFPTLQAPAGVATGNNSGYGEYVVGTGKEFALRDQQHQGFSLEALNPKNMVPATLFSFLLRIQSDHRKQKLDVRLSANIQG